MIRFTHFGVHVESLFISVSNNEGLSSDADPTTDMRQAGVFSGTAQYACGPAYLWKYLLIWNPPLIWYRVWYFHAIDATLHNIHFLPDRPVCVHNDVKISQLTQDK